MKKTTLGILILVVILIVVLGASFYKKEGSGPIADTIRVTLYESDGEINSSALVSIPFLEAVPKGTVRVALDLNFDDVVSDDEVVVNDVSVDGFSDRSTGFYFPAEEGLELVDFGEVTLNGEVIPVKVSVRTRVFEDVIDFSNVTNPNEATLGLGAQTAHAQTIVYEDVPDITQARGECAPTAAANNLIHLIRENGEEGDQITDPRALIEELKDHMNWNPDNGVPWEPFVNGKRSWAEEKGLPIETERIGDFNGLTTLDEIKKALESGDAVELRFQFADAALNNRGGHLVTVTGIDVQDGVTRLAINDPFTDIEGAEIVEIKGNEILHYGPWKGITALSWGFVQTWNDDAAAETGGVSVPEEPSATEVVRESVQNTLETSFAHVVPGQYSEIYATAITNPGTEVTFRATGPGLLEHKGPVVIVADENGVANFTWKINQFGSYTVTSDVLNPGTANTIHKQSIVTVN